MNNCNLTGIEIDAIIKDVLGYDSTVDMGNTGRDLRLIMFGRKETYPERVAFDLSEIAERAEILSDDEFRDAAEMGIRQWLLENREELCVKINTQAEIMRQELLAEEPLQEWEVEA